MDGHPTAVDRHRAVAQASPQADAGSQYHKEREEEVKENIT